MSDLLPVPPPLGWRARLESVLNRRPLRPAHVIALGAFALGLAVVVVWLLRTPPPSESLIPQVSAPAAAQPSEAAADDTTSLIVQAAGSVVSPGVYRLPANARVIDVIDAAGGLAPGADADRLALAARVSDGERVYVPRVGEALPAPPVGASSGSSESGPLDLNTASESDLDALPGVGPATAKAIVAYRSSHGPFTSVDQLLEVRGIGPAKLDQLGDLVTV